MSILFNIITWLTALSCGALSIHMAIGAGADRDDNLKLFSAIFMLVALLLAGTAGI